MNNLIKLGFVVLLLAMATKSFAQTFGVKTGLNLSNMLIKDDYGTDSEDYKMNTGFHFGPTLEFPINEMFAFESGLLFSTKGTKMSEKETYMDETFEAKSKVNLFYLDVPLTAKATFDFGSVKFYGTFGPYVGIGLNGKLKSEMKTNGETETYEEDINFGSDEDEDDLKRLDYGVSAGAGIAFKSIQIGVTYGLGLANISAYIDDGDKVKNRVFGISLGYKLGK
jgi:hypothetical protein